MAGHRGLSSGPQCLNLHQCKPTHAGESLSRGTPIVSQCPAVLSNCETAFRGCRVSVVGAPPGYLFDYDLMADLLRAGVRDPALRDFINRITEPRFLVNGITETQFEETKQYLNSAEYLPVAE